MVEPVETPVCSLCQGREWTTKDNLKSKPCRCIQGRMIKSFLGREIASSERLRSPLFQPGEADRSEENLFLKGSWGVVCRHLRWVLGCKYNLNSAYTYRIVTDLRIIEVTLGKESYGQRARSRRDDVESFNTVGDLVAPSELLIVRLGMMEYQNRAAAGYLKQALGVREAECKPTWLVEEPGRYFGEGCVTWDVDIDDYVREHFDIVDLRSDGDVSAPAPTPMTVPTGHVSDTSVGLGDDGGPEASEEDTIISVESFSGSSEDRSNLRQSQRKRSGRFRPGQRNKNQSGGDGPAGMGL